MSSFSKTRLQCDKFYKHIFLNIKFDFKILIKNNHYSQSCTFLSLTIINITKLQKKLILAYAYVDVYHSGALSFEYKLYEFK